MTKKRFLCWYMLLLCIQVLCATDQTSPGFLRLLVNYALQDNKNMLDESHILVYKQEVLDGYKENLDKAMYEVVLSHFTDASKMHKDYAKYKKQTKNLFASACFTDYEQFYINFETTLFDMQVDFVFVLATMIDKLQRQGADGIDYYHENVYKQSKKEMLTLLNWVSAFTNYDFSIYCEYNDIMIDVFTMVEHDFAISTIDYLTDYIHVSKDNQIETALLKYIANRREKAYDETNHFVDSFFAKCALKNLTNTEYTDKEIGYELHVIWLKKLLTIVVLSLSNIDIADKTRVLQITETEYETYLTQKDEEQDFCLNEVNEKYNLEQYMTKYVVLMKQLTENVEKHMKDVHTKAKAMTVQFCHSYINTIVQAIEKYNAHIQDATITRMCIKLDNLSQYCTDVDMCAYDTNVVALTDKICKRIQSIIKNTTKRIPNVTSDMLQIVDKTHKKYVNMLSTLHENMTGDKQTHDKEIRNMKKVKDNLLKSLSCFVKYVNDCKTIAKTKECEKEENKNSTELINAKSSSYNTQQFDEKAAQNLQ